MNNPVRKALLNRELTIGTWVQIGHAAVGEIFGNCGFDWVAVDGEHTDIDVQGFTDVARGLFGRGPEPFIRVRENDTLAIRQALDAGAKGVIVPLVGTVKEAQNAVKAAKYPPEGVRGFCFSRMNDYGVNFDEYVQSANDNIAVVVMIETKDAIDHIDEILGVDGVDGVFVGPYDLSGSYGIPGKTSHKLVNDGCRKVLDACRNAGKSAGLHVVIPTEENIAKAIDDGFTFIAVGVDTVFIDSSARRSLEIVKSFKPDDKQ